jgi:tetratricopeptide (TPR) repeat protein
VPTPAGVFVGRQRELAVLQRALEDLAAGRGSLVLLSGEGGIGKSRLAEEAAARAAEQGVRVVSGRCWEFGGAPAYRPWAQCLRALARDVAPSTLNAHLGSGAADIAQVVPELRELFGDLRPVPSTDPDGARFRLFDAVAAFLRNASTAKPIVLVLEDLHAADAPSLLLLQFIARELSGTRVLVIATRRDGDRASSEAFGPTLAALGRTEGFHDLALVGLDRQEVAQLVEASGGIDASEAMVDAIHERTDGHPFFVAEIVRLLVSRGRLDGLPQGVRAAVAQRLDLLSEDCREVLAVASVVGREFGADVLAGATGLGSATLLDLMAEAVVAKSLLEVPGAPGRFRFAHALVAEVLYAELAADRRMRLHRRVGEALEAINAAEVERHLVELTRHFSLAAPTGTTTKAIDYATRAARRASDELAYEEAVRLYETALDAHELAPGADAATRCELLLVLGNAQAQANDMVSAKQTFLRAADLARSTEMSERLARAALGYGGRFVMLPADDPRTVPLLEEGLAALGESGAALRARLLARLACARGDPPQGLEAVRLARRLDDPATLLWALEARSVLVWDPREVDEVLRLAEEIIELADDTEEWESGLNGHLLLLELQLLRGNITEVRAHLDAASRMAETLRLPSSRWHVAVHEAELALLAGRFDQAPKFVDIARRLGEQASSAEVTACDAAQRFPVLLERGELEELRPALEGLAAELPKEAVYRCLIARLDWETGHQVEARTTLELLCHDRCAAVNGGPNWLLAMTLLAELAVDLEAPVPARALYELLSPYTLLIAIGPHFFAMGAAARAVGSLAAVLSRPDEAIQHLEGATAINERIGARPWLAHTKVDHARVLLARDRPGDRRSADGLLRNALATYRELGMSASEHKASDLLAEAAVVQP